MREQRYSDALRFTAFYDNQGHLLAVSPIWRAGDYQQPTTPLLQSGTAVHATATQMRVGLTAVLVCVGQRMDGSG